jgi:hypothetical protein
MYTDIPKHIEAHIVTLEGNVYANVLLQKKIEICYCGLPQSAASLTLASDLACFNLVHSTFPSEK